MLKLTEVDVCYLRLLQYKKPQQFSLTAASSNSTWFRRAGLPVSSDICGSGGTNKVHRSSRFFPLMDLSPEPACRVKAMIFFYCLIILLS